MFLTGQFWQALHFPMRQHPIFIQARKPFESANTSSRLGRFIVFAIIASIALAFFVFPISAFLTTLGVVLGFPALMIVFNGTALGTIWVTNVSTTIARYHQRYHYELLSLTSQGAYGVSWHLATGTIHQHNWLRTVYRLLTWVVMLVLVLLGLASLMLIFGIITSNDEIIRQAQFNVLRDVITIVFIVGAVWLDHIQSVVISALLGMLLPRVIKNRVQLQSFAPLIYLMIQAFTYLIVILVYMASSAILLGILGTAFLTSSLIVGLTLVSFFILRETIIHVLVYLLQINYDSLDTDALVN
ncbi:MAG: hypothetical protein Phog2KO_09430 [Phototrophicaceae bacterium]